MKSDNYWRIFIETGSTTAYLNYKKAKKAEKEFLEERGRLLSEFADLGEDRNDTQN
jgi:hypothetical protein